MQSKKFSGHAAPIFHHFSSNSARGFSENDGTTQNTRFLVVNVYMFATQSLTSTWGKDRTEEHTSEWFGGKTLLMIRSTFLVRSLTSSCLGAMGAGFQGEPGWRSCMLIHLQQYNLKALRIQNLPQSRTSVVIHKEWNMPSSSLFILLRLCLAPTRWFQSLSPILQAIPWSDSRCWNIKGVFFTVQPKYKLRSHAESPFDASPAGCLARRSRTLKKKDKKPRSFQKQPSPVRNRQNGKTNSKASSTMSETIWVFPKIGVPQNGWFIMENPIKMDYLGVPLFSETSISAQSLCKFGCWERQPLCGTRSTLALKKAWDSWSGRMELLLLSLPGSVFVAQIPLRTTLSPLA